MILKIEIVVKVFNLTFIIFVLSCGYRAVNKILCYIFLTQYSAGDKNEKNEMGGACGTYGGRERCAQGFGGET